MCCKVFSLFLQTTNFIHPTFLYRIHKSHFKIALLTGYSTTKYPQKQSEQKAKQKQKNQKIYTTENLPEILKKKKKKIHSPKCNLPLTYSPSKACDLVFHSAHTSSYTKKHYPNTLVTLTFVTFLFNHSFSAEKNTCCTHNLSK